MRLILLFLLSFQILFAKEITFGIVPQQSPLKLSKKWLQITDYLSKETGLTVVFKTEKSIPAFEKNLYAGLYDFSYMNPYHFVIANEKQNYKAKIRAAKNIRGILVSKNRDFKLSKKNLENKTILYPAPKAFAATMLTKYELQKKFDLSVDEKMKVLYVNSHDSVYKGVLRDIGFVGGGIERTFSNFNKADKKEVFIIYRTNKYPSHPIAFHPRVDIKDIKLVEKAFLKMPKHLKKILSIKSFVETNNDEYNVIKMFK